MRSRLRTPACTHPPDQPTYLPAAPGLGSTCRLLPHLRSHIHHQGQGFPLWCIPRPVAPSTHCDSWKHSEKVQMCEGGGKMPLLLVPNRGFRSLSSLFALNFCIDETQGRNPEGRTDSSHDACLVDTKESPGILLSVLWKLAPRAYSLNDTSLY